MAQFELRDYIDVQERISHFWTEYPNGRIETNLMSPPDDFTQCRYVARVFKDAAVDRLPDATGWAFELAGGGGANRTSHEENCETSAIGRALANMGYATSGKDRPSKQEMTKANRPTHGQPPPQGLRMRPHVTDASEHAVERVEAETGEIRAAPITHAQINEMGGLMKQLDWHIAHRQNWLKKHAGSEKYQEFSQEKAEGVLEELRALRDAELQKGLPQALVANPG